LQGTDRILPKTIRNGTLESERVRTFLAAALVATFSTNEPLRTYAYMVDFELPIINSDYYFS
jgi:hypothetical protein